MTVSFDSANLPCKRNVACTARIAAQSTMRARKMLEPPACAMPSLVIVVVITMTKDINKSRTAETRLFQVRSMAASIARIAASTSILGARKTPMPACIAATTKKPPAESFVILSASSLLSIFENSPTFFGSCCMSESWWGCVVAQQLSERHWRGEFAAVFAVPGRLNPDHWLSSNESPVSRPWLHSPVGPTPPSAL